MTLTPSMVLDIWALVEEGRVASESDSFLPTGFRSQLAEHLDEAVRDDAMVGIWRQVTKTDGYRRAHSALTLVYVRRQTVGTLGVFDRVAHGAFLEALTKKLDAQPLSVEVDPQAFEVYQRWRGMQDAKEYKADHARMSRAVVA